MAKAAGYRDYYHSVITDLGPAQCLSNADIMAIDEYRDDLVITEVHRLAIESTSGYWWTGAGWGVKEAREVYNGVNELPETLETVRPDGHMEPADLDVHDSGCAADDIGPDARYYEDGNDDAIASARVVP